LTESRTYEIAGRVGRKLEFPERITLPLAEGTKARLDGLRQDGEDRVSIIREAIDREIKRRERAKP
jgi:hypothetical protein